MSELASVELVSRNAVRVVLVRGEVDLSNAPEVGHAIGAVISNDATIVVDLSGTEYVDSAGIAMLFRLDQRLKHMRQQLRLVVPQDSPIRVALRLSGLDQVVPIVDSVELA